MSAATEAPVRSSPTPVRGEQVVSRGRPAVTRPRFVHRLAIGVAVLGLALTAALTVSSRLSYEHEQQRLTSSQAQLIASSLGVAQVDLERRLGEALYAASEAKDPASAFRQAIGPSMAPTGPFANAGLRLVRAGRLESLTYLGAAPLRSLKSPAALAPLENAAHSGTLIVTRVVVGRQQRLAYALATVGPAGTYVAAATQTLPASRRITIPPSAPYADLNIAIYFGAHVTSAALVESSTGQLPLRGITGTAQVPLGTSVLTLVASPRGPLDDSPDAALPWIVLGVGVAFSGGIAAMTDRLVRRRRRAEQLALENSQLYREQRSISETLQRALLPRKLPSISDVEMAALYLPGSAGLEVGGDWYSAIAVDEHRFAFVVGDVSGRGVRAATVMASLRYTIRAFASLGYEPSTILEKASGEIDLASDDHFATVLVGMFDKRRGELTVASAGHPPPLLVDSERAEFVEVPHGVPLGVGHYAYDSVTVPIRAAGTLLAYTDGLIERRGVSLDEGLEALRRAAVAHRGSVKDLLDHVVAELVQGGGDDDLAFLGLRWNIEASPEE